MDASVLSTIISATGTIFCAIIAGMFSKEQKRKKKYDAEVEARAKQRALEGKLQLRMLEANSQLTVGVAMALKTGHANGEIESGLAAVNTAATAYTEFLEGIALEQIKSA